MDASGLVKGAARTRASEAQVDYSCELVGVNSPPPMCGQQEERVWPRCHHSPEHSLHGNIQGLGHKVRPLCHERPEHSLHSAHQSSWKVWPLCRKRPELSLLFRVQLEGFVVWPLCHERPEHSLQIKHQVSGLTPLFPFPLPLGVPLGSVAYGEGDGARETGLTNLFLASCDIGA